MESFLCIRHSIAIICHACLIDTLTDIVILCSWPSTHTYEIILC